MIQKIVACDDAMLFCNKFARWYKRQSHAMMRCSFVTKKPKHQNFYHLLSPRARRLQTDYAPRPSWASRSRPPGTLPSNHLAKLLQKIVASQENQHINFYQWSATRPKFGRISIYDNSSNVWTTFRGSKSWRIIINGDSSKFRASCRPLISTICWIILQSCYKRS